MDCVDAIVAWADQQIAIHRETCYQEGLIEYDLWSWDLYYCNEWFLSSNCRAPSCALKMDMCQDLAYLSLWHELAINDAEYHSWANSIKWTAQWQIDNYCY